MHSADLPGRVVDATSGEPVARAEVRVEGRATPIVTGADGRFVIPGFTAASIKAACVGYLPFSQSLPAEQNEIEIALQPDTLRRTDSVQVAAGPYGNEPTPFSTSLRGQELRNLGTVIADDPMRAIQSMPGATAGDEFQAQFSMRGAGYNRIGVYLDGILLHSPFHSVQGDQASASISAIQGEMLDAATLHAGAPPVMFGDRTAGAVEFYSRESSGKKIHVRASASMASMGFSGDGPLGDKGFWVAAIRKSYLQYIINLTSTDTTLAFGYWDSQAKAVYRPKPNHQISILGLDGHSGLDRSARIQQLSVDSLMLTHNRLNLFDLGYRYTPASGWIAQSTTAFIQEDYSLLNPAQRSLGYGHYGEWSSNNSVTKAITPGAVFDVGFSARRVSGSGNFLNQLTPPLAPQVLDSYRGSGIRTGGYAQQSFHLARRIELKIGGRADHHDANPVIAWSPYVSLGVKLGEGARLSLAWSQAAQFGDVPQLWSIYGRPTLLPERSIHYQGAIEQLFGERTRLRVEAYSRQDRDLLDRPLFDPRLLSGRYLNTTRTASWLNSGRGWSRGGLITLQRRATNNLTGWVSYGYGETRLRDGVAHTLYPSDFDQRHTAQAYGSYRIRPTINLSGKWLYGSGLPVPGFFESRGVDTYLSTNRNALRLPNFQRLDLRINKAFVRKYFQATLFAEVVNATDRGNRRFDQLRSFDARTGKASIAYDQTFPVLPVAGLVIDF